MCASGRASENRVGRHAARLRATLRRSLALLAAERDLVAVVEVEGPQREVGIRRERSTGPVVAGLDVTEQAVIGIV